VEFKDSVEQKCAEVLRKLVPIIYRDIDLSKVIFERLSHGDIHV
jgi:hypothetical protein